ncbi:MAG TPA: nicotinate (nicotinamide) nucleotide adenylyltransferase [Luteibaculaceae bacterium]|nr:nicotinate (nicotinamide) nucleotide adenylyltransferase [Luteibaculaceae bacterium]
MKKIGLFFGSFNPIHVGHLIIAQHIINHTDIDQVCFVLSPQNPSKPKETLLQDYHRLALVNVAIEGNPQFSSSDIEFKLSKPSYTINTLTHLKEKHPQQAFYLIMGEDNLNTLHKWKNADQIIRQFPIIVYPRIDDLHTPDSEFLAQATILRCDAPIVKISSSYIRQLIVDGKSTLYVLPEPVRRYVEEMNFYKAPPK